MKRGDELLQLRRGQSLEAFERAFASLWLVRPLTDVQPTQFTTASFRPDALDKAVRRGGPPRLIDKLQIQPEQFALHPLEKGDGNPWRDRIYVGRTTNNDIAVPHESISKVQAYFQRAADGTWRLYDAESTNGTRVGELQLPPGGAAEVAPGTRITFGSVVCELATSAELFD